MCANPQSNWLNTLAVRASYILLILSFGVDPLNWQSFIEIGEIACSTTARCSRGHATNLLRDSCGLCHATIGKKENRFFLNANISNAQHYTQTNIP